ncbi:MAG: diphosphomevalonate decarboxylase [Deltaproteobacteria bacterium]|nr:diphosphomevalonate decarboxylase [Deltaproteobacteria bacterium]
MDEAVARANSNVALVQSWGARLPELNLPYTGSISLTLDGPCSTVRWSNRPDLATDRITIDDRPAQGASALRLQAYVDLVRRAGAGRSPCEVTIETTPGGVPGVGRSTATFAALALAGSAALGRRPTPRELSILARRGTGSAARSVFGGFVESVGGELGDGSDCYAEPLAEPQHWPLAALIAVVECDAATPRATVSAHDLKRSPFFPAWLEAHDDDLEAVRDAILARDLDRLGRAMEHNCLKARAVALAAAPPIISWAPATLAVIERVHALRAAGRGAYFTVGAGPHVTVLCAPDDSAPVAHALANVAGVAHVVRTRPGGAAELVQRA